MVNWVDRPQYVVSKGTYITDLIYRYNFNFMHVFWTFNYAWRVDHVHLLYSYVDWVDNPTVYKVGRSNIAQLVLPASNFWHLFVTFTIFVST